MPLSLPNPMNLPMPSGTVGPMPPMPSMPPMPNPVNSMGIAGGSPGGQTNPLGSTARKLDGGPKPRTPSSRGADKALKSIDNPVKESSITLPLTKRAFLERAKKTIGDFAEGAGHAVLDEVDKQKKTKQTDEHRAHPPQQNRLS